jgi:hypothetical protein
MGVNFTLNFCEMYEFLRNLVRKPLSFSIAHEIGKPVMMAAGFSGEI